MKLQFKKMNIVLYLASKYLKFKATERGISTIAVIALLTIVISTAASIVILSASNGFHYNFMKKLMAKDAHITVIGAGKGIADYEDYIQKISKIEGVTAVSPVFDKQALIKGQLNTWGAVIKGIPIDAYEKDTDFNNQFKLVDGSFDFSEPMSIILGENLANNLGVSIGSFVNVTVYHEDFMSLDFRFTVKGLFTAGYAEYDSNLAFILFENAQEIFDSVGYADRLSIKVSDPFNVDEIKKAVRRVCPLHTRTWKELNMNSLIALENEKMLIMIILTFFFIVVGFNILSTMIAMVLDKKEEIGILKAMGLSPKKTLSVFIFDGFLIGTAGSTFGVIAGLFITITLNDILRFIEVVIDFINFGAYFMLKWIPGIYKPAKFEFFKSSVYYIREFPIRMEFGDVIFVISMAVVLSTLAVIIPAMNASRFRPVEVLRND